MAVTLAEVDAQARLLTPEDRARLAELLLESLDAPESVQHQAAWHREIEARVTAYERGESTTHAAEDVLAEARRMLGR